MLTPAQPTPAPERSSAGRRTPEGSRSPAVMLIAALVAAVVVVPLGYVVWYAVALGPAELWTLLSRPRVAELTRHTVFLLVAVMITSTTLGVACAWLVERTDVPLPTLWHVLFAAPLAVPAFVNSYGWVSTTHAVQSYGGAVLVVTLSYFPLVYLPMVAGLRGLDPALEEVAAALGQTRRQVFTRVVLRGTRPAVLGGALLVGLHTLAEFGALQMLQFPTFTTAIYDQYRSAFNSAPANALAVVLVFFCLVLLVGEQAWRGGTRIARVGSGAARPPERIRLGRARVPAVAGMVALVLLALGVPLVSLLRWLVVGTSTAFPVADLASATVSTVGLAAGAAVLAVLMALPLSWVAVRRRGAVATVIERAAYTAHSLPGIVVALALVTVSIRVVQPIYQTVPLLLLGYAILFLPRALVSVRSSLEQAPPVLEDVAASLGERPFGVLVRVVLPIVRAGLGSGAALVFLAVATELTMTLLMSPIGTTTLATEFWNQATSVRYGAAAPYALLLVMISIPATWILGVQARKGALG